MNEYLFFLSYDRENWTDELGKFIGDLEKQLRAHTDHDVDRLGFVDVKELRTGDAWRENLQEALQSCRVFIPLYSSRYFGSSFCGKEWAFFRQRQALAEEGGVLPPVVLPVLWSYRDTLPDPLPDPAHGIQYAHDDFGEGYPSEGLYSFISRSIRRAEYEQFVDAFARRLIAVAKAHGAALPRLPDPPALDDVAELFPAPAAAPPGPEARDRPQDRPAVRSTRGPRWVKFVCVAGNYEELRAIRPGLGEALREVYGHGGAAWCPFYPDNEDVVLHIANAAALEANLTAEGTLDVDDALLERLREAEARRKIVVFLVDAWSLYLPDYEERMRAVDERSLANCTVLVPWNLKDADTHAQREALEQTLHRAFPRWPLISPDRFITSITSAEDFRAHLAEALTRTRGLVLKLSDAQRPLPADRVVPRPRIDAVGGRG